MIKFNHLKPNLVPPLPVTIVAVVNTTTTTTPTLLSTLVEDEHCFSGHLHHSIRFKTRHQLILLECLTTNTCLAMLNALIDHNLIDGIVSPRYFLVLLTPNLGVYDTLTKRVFQSYPKIHAIIFLVTTTKPKATFVRPLRNICLEEKSSIEFSDINLDVGVLLRHLLAIDNNDQVIGCDFDHQLLTAVLIKAITCEFESVDGRITQLHPSVEVNALNLLSEQYHFTYQAIDANGSYGAQVGGAWQGATGYVVNGTADIALCDLIFTHDRFRVVDITFPFDLVPVTFMTRKPGHRIRKWAFFFSLPIAIWAMLLVCVVLLAMLLDRLRTIAAARVLDRGRGSMWLALMSILWQQCKLFVFFYDQSILMDIGSVIKFRGSNVHVERSSETNLPAVVIQYFDHNARIQWRVLFDDNISRGGDAHRYHCRADASRRQRSSKGIHFAFSLQHGT